MNHDKCRRGVWAPDQMPSPMLGGWACVGCGYPIAYAARTALHVIVPNTLVAMPSLHDGLPTFGLRKRALMAGAAGYTETARATDGYVGTAARHVYAYCPKAGVCGVGQHLEVPQDVISAELARRG